MRLEIRAASRAVLAAFLIEIFATAFSCAGPDFTTAITTESDASAMDASAEFVTYVICTDCQDPTMDAGDENSDAAPDGGWLRMDAADVCDGPGSCGDGTGGASCVSCALPNAISACANDACAIDHCLLNFQDCNGVASDGCEANTLVDPQHCGSCAACNLGPCKGELFGWAMRGRCVQSELWRLQRHCCGWLRD